MQNLIKNLINLIISNKFQRLYSLYMLAKSQRPKKYSILTHIYILILIANTLSCTCGNKGPKSDKKYTDLEGKLIMQVKPLQLDQSNMITTATFELAEAGKTVDLSKYRLQATIIKQEGGTNSRFSYQDGAGISKYASELDILLTHFTPLTSLEDKNSPLKIAFKIIPGPKVTLLIYQIEAFDAENNSIGSYAVKYEKPYRGIPTLNLESEKNLYGANKEIKLEIFNPSNEPILAGTLKLHISRIGNSNALIIDSKATNSPNIHEIIINETIGGNQTIGKSLTIDTKNDSKAEFNIHLIDQKSNQSDPISIRWQEEEIQIKDWHTLIANQEASFTLFNPIKEIEHNQFTIGLSSNNKATFTLIAKDNKECGSNSALDKLIGSGLTATNMKTIPIRCKLHKANGETKAQITIEVKRGPLVLAKQIVSWEASGISLLMVKQGDPSPYFQNQELGKIALKCLIGTIQNTEKIRVRLTNDKNVAFKIGNWITKTTADTSLKTIINQDQLKQHETVYFDIQQDGALIPDLYNANIMLELLNEAGTSLTKIELTWRNEAKINNVLKPMINSCKQLKKDCLENIQAYCDTPLTNLNRPADYEAANMIMQKIIKIRGDFKSLIQKVNVESISMYEQLQQGDKNAIAELSVFVKREVDPKIEEFLQTIDDNIQYLVEEATKSIEKLEKATDPKDIQKFIIELDNALASINKMLDSITYIANTNEFSEAEDILKKSRRIAKKTEKLAKDAKKKASNRTSNTDDYIKQIENATVDKAIEIARNCFDLAIKNNNKQNPTLEEALHAYYLIIDKAYKASKGEDLAINWNQLNDIIEGVKNSIGKMRKEQAHQPEPANQMALSLGYAIILMTKFDNTGPSYKLLRIKSILDYINNGPVKFETYASASEEAKNIVKQAQKAIEDLELTPKNTTPTTKNITPITEKMIRQAGNMGAYFAQEILTKLKRGEKLDINQTNPKDTDKRTALWDVTGRLAFGYEYNNQVQDIIRALLDRGADITIQCDCDGGKFNALDILMYPTFKHEPLKFLINEIITRNLQPALMAKYNHGTILYIVTTLGWADEAQKILDKKPDIINEQDNAGNTALHYAVYWPERNIIKLLLDRGANMNIKNKKGQIPYDLKRVPLGLGLDERIKPKI